VTSSDVSVDEAMSVEVTSSDVSTDETTSVGVTSSEVIVVGIGISALSSSCRVSLMIAGGTKIKSKLEAK
jgi:hypothetical protein